MIYFQIASWVASCEVGVCFLTEQDWSFVTVVTADVLEDKPEKFNMLLSVTFSSQPTALVVWFSVSLDDRLSRKGTPFDKCDLPSCSLPLTCHFTSGALQGPKLELLPEFESMLLAGPCPLPLSVKLTSVSLESNSWSLTWFRGCSSPVLASNVLVQLGFRCCFSCSLHGRCLVRHILWLKVLLQVSHL